MAGGHGDVVLGRHSSGGGVRTGVGGLVGTLVSSAGVSRGTSRGVTDAEIAVGFGDASGSLSGDVDDRLALGINAEAVDADGEGMALVEGPDRVTFPLTHWDADTFTYVGAPELPDLRAQSRSRSDQTVGPRRSSSETLTEKASAR